MTSRLSKIDRKAHLSPIQVLNRQRRFKIDRGAIASYCKAVLQSLGEEEGFLTVVFVSVARIQSLNSVHRRVNYPTDVLSFSYGREIVEGHSILGDIVICPQIAERQAQRVGTSADREICRLLVHGILHLLEYDHENDRGEMAGLQKRLMRRKSLKTIPHLLGLE